MGNFFFERVINYKGYLVELQGLIYLIFCLFVISAC